MPVYIECSSCHRKLRVRTDLVGKHIRCPSCQAKFLAQPAPEQAPASEDPGSAPAESGPTSTLPSPAPPAEEDAPTVRRPASVPDAHDLAAALAPGPPVPVPDAPADQSPPPRQPATPVPPEMPARQVFLVLGLVLVGVVVLALIGAWWVTAGIQSVRGKRAETAPRTALVQAPAGEGKVTPGRASVW
ncbi:MAG: hypothetical protein L0Z62_39780 [Gemmataceae bacterium]|nr:hypothetical protein [Gemmataceae bacterium]